MIHQIKIFLTNCIWNFYTKPKGVLLFLINGRGKIYDRSYYPELPSKSKFRIWLDQLIQCCKYGSPNEFYYPYGFDVKNSDQIHEYLHYTPFMNIRDTRNITPHSATAILRDKLYFGFFTHALGINSGNNVGIFQSDKIFDCKKKKYVNPISFLKGLSGKYIFKPIDGECGGGIFIINILHDKCLMDDKSIEFEILINKIVKEDYLIQEVVTQHPLMASLHPQSLNTIRFVTVRNIHSGEIEPFPSILRIGTGKSFVDNTSQGGLAVAVDLQTGRLGEYGFYKPKFGTKVSIHPDSGIKFSEFTIPFFEEAKEQALLLHKMLPSVNSIGWDIAIGTKGPVFIEGNDNWEINGPQICNGGLKKVFLSYLE